MNTREIIVCPADLDERAELYCLNRLSAREARVFENHLIVCPVCLAAVLDTELFLESLICALKQCRMSSIN